VFFVVKDVSDFTLLPVASAFANRFGRMVVPIEESDKPSLHVGLQRVTRVAHLIRRT
jgi:hypothetical protein